MYRFSFGMICAVVLLFQFCGLAVAQQTQPKQVNIRVLIVDPKNPVLPARDEKLQRLDSKKDAHTFVAGLKFSGTIEVFRGEKGIYVVNEMPLEEYVKGVIVSEVGSSWDAEALKAQAVAARTYAIFQMQNVSRTVAGFHLTSSVLHQVYRSGSVPDSIIKAVEATKNEVLLFEGKPIIAYYHSTSGGMTEDPVEVFGKEYPYLKVVETNSELSPYYMWQRSIPVAEIEKAVEMASIKDISIFSLTSSMRSKELKIKNTDKEFIMSAKDFRRKLGWERLPSTLITGISIQNGSMIFEGRGYGHGVGLCQWSSLQMAKDGKSYKDILHKFYPGTVLESYVVR